MSSVKRALEKALRYLECDPDGEEHEPGKCWCTLTGDDVGPVLMCEACLIREALAVCPSEDSVPMAWAVHCPGDKEFDFQIFPERRDAEATAMRWAEETDSPEWQVIPLFAGAEIAIG